jgi:hypothetical protein
MRLVFALFQNPLQYGMHIPQCILLTWRIATESGRYSNRNRTDAISFYSLPYKDKKILSLLNFRVIFMVGIFPFSVLLRILIKWCSLSSHRNFPGRSISAVVTVVNSYCYLFCYSCSEEWSNFLNHWDYRNHIRNIRVKLLISRISLQVIFKLQLFYCHPLCSAKYYTFCEFCVLYTVVNLHLLLLLP